MHKQKSPKIIGTPKNRRFLHSRGLVAVIAGLMALSLSACGTNTSEAEDSSDPTKLTVAVSPGAATSAPIYLGVKKGFFEEQGLDVELTVLSGGTVAIPQVLNGQAQFSMASFAPVIDAVAEGLPIKMISAANVSPTDPDAKYQAVIKSEKLKDIEDARTFAASSTEPDPEHRHIIEKFGGHYSDLQILQVPDGSIGDALKNGDADMSILREPFLSDALANGGVDLVDYISPEESIAGAPGAVFIAAEDYLNENPQIAKDFTTALQKTYDYANNNMEEIASFVPETGLTDHEVPVVALGKYPEKLLNLDKIDELLQLYIEYGEADDSLTSQKIVHETQ